MKYSIDRFEENFAVLQNEKGESIITEKKLLPSEAKEGSMLIFDGKNYITDTDSEKAVKKCNYEKQQALLRRKKKH